MTDVGEGERAPGRNADLIYWTVLTFAGVIWGATFVLARIAVEGGAHPIGLSGVHALIGVLVLSVVLLWRRKRLPVSRRHLLFYAFCGLTGTALPGTLYFYAAEHVPSGVLAITLATVPMLTVALAFLFRIERPALSRLCGLVLGIAGVGLIVLPDSSLPDPAILPWVLIALGCALCYAIENTFIALQMPEDIDAITVLCGMMGMASVMTFAVAWAMDALYVPSFPPGAVEWSVLLMSLINVTAYAMFVYLISNAGPVFASQMAYVVTLSGVAWGMVLFNEQHSGWIWASLIVLMIGMALVKPQDDRAFDQ